MQLRHPGASAFVMLAATACQAPSEAERAAPPTPTVSASKVDAAPPRPDGVAASDPVRVSRVDCVAREDDVVRFLLTLPEAVAQNRYQRLNKLPPSRVKIVVENWAHHGCPFSKYSPLDCDWVMLVDGPLFRARYYVHPLYKRIDAVDERPYADWCRMMRSRHERWWTSEQDCQDAVMQSEDEMSPGNAVCTW